MFKNYFKIAIRSLLKNSVYSFINIAGLSIGLACSILILLWVWDEVTFNQSFSNYQHVHQIMLNAKVDKGIATGNAMPFPLRDVLIQQDSRIKTVSVTNWGEGALLGVDDKKINKVGLWATEPFMTMFGFKMVYGNPSTALSDATGIVLSKATAIALFGNVDPINKIVRVDDANDLRVSAVFDDLPDNTSFGNLEFIIPFAHYEKTQSWVKRTKDNWENHSFQMYVELQPGADIAEVNRSISGLETKHNPEAKDVELFLHPMTDWHLYSRFENGKKAGGMIEYVRLFSIIAAFVLVIACINFMNLATARSESRAREVGIRKSIGSRRKDLVFQFLGESIFISFIAFLTAVLLVEVSLPFYNSIVNKHLQIQYTNPYLWLGALAIVLITGTLSGSYPALYLSSFHPVKVLKGRIKLGRNAATPRQILVTLQFGFSILLMAGTVVIYQQIQHVRSRDVGYNRENLLLFWTTTDIEKNYKALKNDLINSGVVESVCKSNSPITSIFSTNELQEWTGKQPDQRIDFTTIATEYDYAKTMGIKMLEGRDFSEDFKSDTAAMVVNQATVDILGLTDPVGERVKMWDTWYTIIGVMDNVIMESPDHPVEPLVMVLSPTWSSTISVRITPTENIDQTLATMEKIFKKHNPVFPFEYRFADAEFNKKFAAINLISTLAGVFATLTIIITCLGLFGLAAFTAEQRTKEIGIRKVMGATVSSIVMLISKDFSKLVLVAFVIAGPIAVYLLNNFLERYPYRTDIAWWVLPSIGLVALTLALIIVSTQAVRAAVDNPVNSLRSE